MHTLSLTPASVEYALPSIPSAVEDVLSSDDMLASYGHARSEFASDRYATTLFRLSLRYHVLRAINNGQESDRDVSGRQLLEAMRSEDPTLDSRARAAVEITAEEILAGSDPRTAYRDGCHWFTGDNREALQKTLYTRLIEILHFGRPGERRSTLAALLNLVWNDVTETGD